MSYCLEVVSGLAAHTAPLQHAADSSIMGHSVGTMREWYHCTKLNYSRNVLEVSAFRAAVCVLQPLFVFLIEDGEISFE